MSSMKNVLACADFSFPLIPHEKALNLIASLDLEGVDIGLFAKGTHLSFHEEFKNMPFSARRLAQMIKSFGLKISDVFLTPGEDFVTLAPNHPDYKERQRSREIFERTLEYTVRCGAGHMTALPGYVPDHQEDEAFERCVEEMAWRVEMARGAGVIFSVEPHIGSVIPSPALADKLVSKVPGLTLTLDYSHFIRVGIPQEQIDPLIRHASHFHARCACKNKLQASFKDNVIDFRRIVSLMKQHGYSGALGIEYVWIDWEHCNEVDNLSEIVLLRDFLKKCMKENEIERE